MALQKEYQSNFGVNFPEAYHRISSITINRGVHGDENVTVIMDTWVSVAERWKLLSPIYRKYYVLLPIEDKIMPNSMITEIYNRLKVLEDFVESLDV